MYFIHPHRNKLPRYYAILLQALPSQASISPKTLACLHLLDASFLTWPLPGLCFSSAVRWQTARKSGKLGRLAVLSLCSGILDARFLVLPIVESLLPLSQGFSCSEVAKSLVWICGVFEVAPREQTCFLQRSRWERLGGAGARYGHCEAWTTSLHGDLRSSCRESWWSPLLRMAEAREIEALGLGLGFVYDGVRGMQTKIWAC